MKIILVSKLMFDNWGPFGFIIDFFKKLFQNPLITFIYSIFSQWYLIIVVGSIIVTYWFFKGLKDTGVIDGAQNILVQAVNESKAIAQNCTPKITDLKGFWSCLSSPGVYRASSSDQDLQDLVGGVVNAPINNSRSTKEQNTSSTTYDSGGK